MAGRSVLGEMAQAVAEVVAELGEGDGAEVWRVGIEAAKGVGEEALRTEAVVALQMMASRGDLDEALEEGLFGFGGVSPEVFPGLVRVPEEACVVAVQAFGQRTGGPVKVHASRVPEWSPGLERWMFGDDISTRSDSK